MDTKEAVTTIAQTLGETKAEPLARLQAVVEIIGAEQALALCEEALEVEKQGGILTKDGSRRRTPGGTFFYLARGQYKQVRRLWRRPSKKPTVKPDSPPTIEKQ